MDKTKELAYADRSYMTADDVTTMLGVGRTSAYGIIRRVRADAIKKNKLPVDYPKGKIPKALMAKFYI